jgi:lysyl-tRNA synthetase class 2
VQAEHEEQEIDPTQYTRNRLQVLAEVKAKGINPYPHKFHTTMRLPEFVKTYSKLDAAQRLEDKIVSVAGRSALDTKSSRILIS